MGMSEFPLFDTDAGALDSWLEQHGHMMWSSVASVTHSDETDCLENCWTQTVLALHN